MLGVERFLVEFVRAKNDQVAGPITAAQLTALGGLRRGGILMAVWKQKVEPGTYLTTGTKA